MTERSIEYQATALTIENKRLREALSMLDTALLAASDDQPLGDARRGVTPELHRLNTRRCLMSGQSEDHVVCPATITSPAPGYGLPPNLPCGLGVPVMQEAEAMDFRCPRGHRFLATPADIVRCAEEKP